MNEGSRLQRQSDSEDMILVRVPPLARIIQLEEDLRDIEEGSGNLSFLGHLSLVARAALLRARGHLLLLSRFLQRRN